MTLNNIIKFVIAASIGYFVGGFVINRTPLKNWM